MGYTLIVIGTQDVRALLVNTGVTVTFMTAIVRITMDAIIMVASKMKYLSLNGWIATKTRMLPKKNVVM